MHIGLVYYTIVNHNAIGRCNRLILENLCDELQFTVFAREFDNPRPDRIAWVRIPAPRRPLFLTFVIFHIMFLLAYAWLRLIRRQRIDLIQGIESTNLVSDICYSHFCHRYYLNNFQSLRTIRSLRGAAKYLDHWLHSKLEKPVYRRTKSILVPSWGLERELSTTYPITATKTRVLANPVEIEKYSRPPEQDRMVLRQNLGLITDDLALAFVALGHFERKGLALLIEAIQMISSPRLKLLVIGGTESENRQYRSLVSQRGVSRQIQFCGTHKDLRPYLWAADCFALPSSYEVFPLVALEAAAASLPLLVTRLNGVEEFISHGRNGFVVEPRTAIAVARTLELALNLGKDEIAAMGEEARVAVARYSLPHFVAGWKEFYGQIERPLRNRTAEIRIRAQNYLA